MPWDLPWHLLRFPGTNIAAHSDAGWLRICQHCYCMPLHLPNSSAKQKPMLSEMLTVRLTCLLFGFLCSLCLDILCTTELGMPSWGYFLFHALIPSRPLLLDTYAGLCRLRNIPTFPLDPSCHACSSCCCSATFGALGSIRNKKGNTLCLPLLPPAALSHVLIPSSSASFELKVVLFREQTRVHVFITGTVRRHSSPFPDAHIACNPEEQCFLTLSKSILFSFNFESMVMTQASSAVPGSVHSPSSILVWLQEMWKSFMQMGTGERHWTQPSKAHSFLEVREEP